MTSFDSNRPQQASATDLALPEVYLLWESRRFPLRSLCTKQFVVQCESIVRGHNPNQPAPVCNATLTSDLSDDDIPVLFRVTGTDRQFARCQLAALSHAKSERIERLNSAWQSALSVAAIQRVEAAKTAEAERRAASDQAASAQAAAAIAAADPLQTTRDTSTPAKPAPVVADNRSSNLARYSLAAVIAMTVLGLLFARFGNEETNKVASTDTSAIASETSAKGELKEADIGNPSLTDAPAKSSDKSPTSGVAQASAQSPTMPRDADSSATSDAAIAKLELRLDKSRRLMEQATRDHQEALAQQAGQHAKMKAKHAAKLAEATSELEQANKKVSDGESLLNDLAPLIADENIGTAEVDKIKQDLADAKKLADSKRDDAKRLRQQAALGFDLPMQDEIDALATKRRLIEQDIQQLLESMKLLENGHGATVQQAN